MSFFIFMIFFFRVFNAEAIIGGEIETNNEFKSAMVALSPYKNAYRPFCSGVYIGQETVLTAAHCIQGQFPNYVLFSVQDQTFGCAIQKMYVYEKFESHLDWYDIGLIKIKCDDFDLKQIKPFKLNFKKQIELENQHSMYQVLGYGKKQLNDDRLSFPDLNRLEVNILNLSFILAQNKINPERVKSDLVETRANMQNKNYSICFDTQFPKLFFSGDSGGAILSYNSETKQNELIGVITSGFTRESATQPDWLTVYTSCGVLLHHYQEWIETKIKKLKI